VITALLAALKAGPMIFEAGRSLYNAFTGEETQAGTPEELEQQIRSLPPEQREALTAKILDFKAKQEMYDTQRFALLTEGDAKKVTATARPKIALQAMLVVMVMGFSLAGIFFVAVLDWGLQLYFALSKSQTYPEGISIWKSLQDAEGAWTLLSVPALGAFWACVEIIKKYMGCRERDKARRDEIIAGRPLDSTAATIQASTGAISSLVKAIRG